MPLGLIGLGQDTTPAISDDTGMLPGSEPETTSFSTVAYEPAPPVAATPPGFVADPKVVKGLQNAINRFYGVVIGAPIAVDGVIGGETTAGVQAILSGLPALGFDPSGLTACVGVNPTQASIAMQAACASNIIDWYADQGGYTEGVIPTALSAISSATGSNVPAVHTAAGIAPATIPTNGPSQQAATSILGLGLPDWAWYVAGGMLVVGIGFLIWKHKRPGMLAEYSMEDEDEGEDDYDTSEHEDLMNG